MIRLRRRAIAPDLRAFLVEVRPLLDLLDRLDPSREAEIGFVADQLADVEAAAERHGVVLRAGAPRRMGG